MYQLLPETLSANEKLPNGVPVNPLYLQHMRSALRHFISMRLPVMVLREQIRICPGLIDLSMTIFYKYWQLVYAPTNTLDAHSLCAARETWACGDLKLPASPTGKVLLVFVHCHDTSVKFTDVAMSRENPSMLQVTIIILKCLIKEIGIKPRDIAIVTPYKAQLLRLKDRRRKWAFLVDKDHRVQLTTADRVQGAEREIILFLMVKTAKAGAGFLCDSNRLDVISTRAMDFLTIVGHRGVCVKAPGQNQTEIDMKPLLDWLEWFWRNRRVVDASTLDFITKGDGNTCP